MERNTCISGKKQFSDQLVSEDRNIDDTSASDRSVSPGSSASSLLRGMSFDKFTEPTNTLQSFPELLQEKKCNVSNVSSKQQGGDANVRGEMVWFRCMEPKRVVSCGRKTLLTWINTELCESYIDLSELNDGVAFCRLINRIAPGIIPMSKIKFYLGVTSWIDNFKLLQQAFVDLKINKTVPSQGRKLNPKEVLVFTSWLKGFIEMNAQLIPRSKIIIVEGVGDCSNRGIESRSGCGEYRHVVGSSSDIIGMLEKSQKIGDELKLDRKQPPFIGAGQRNDTQTFTTSLTENGLSKISASTNLSSDTLSHGSNHPIRLICPKRFKFCGRKTLLTWINDELSQDIVDLTELSDGAVYCLLLNILTPETVPLKRIMIKLDPFMHLYNYKLLKVAFRHHKVKKTIPVKKLIAHSTKEILLFTNWMKAFYELNMALLPAMNTCT